MEPATISAFRVRRKRLGPSLDFGSFFLFFGISGTDEGRGERLQKRFEGEYYRHLVTLKLSGSVPPGRYWLRKLTEEANKRGWTVRADGRATSDLSDEGLRDLNTWLASGARQVHLDPLNESSPRR